MVELPSKTHLTFNIHIQHFFKLVQFYYPLARKDYSDFTPCNCQRIFLFSQKQVAPYCTIPALMLYWDRFKFVTRRFLRHWFGCGLGQEEMRCAHQLIQIRGEHNCARFLVNRIELLQLVICQTNLVIPHRLVCSVVILQTAG